MIPVERSDAEDQKKIRALERRISVLRDDLEREKARSSELISAHKRELDQLKKLRRDQGVVVESPKGRAVDESLNSLFVECGELTRRVPT